MSITIEEQDHEQRGRVGRLVTWVLAVVVASAGLVLLGGSPAGAAPTAPTACTTGALLGDTAGVDTIEAGAQQDFLRRLNDLRRAKGLGPLAWNGAMAAPSIGWSQTMSAQDWLHHARDVGAGDGVEPSQDYVTINSRIVSNWQRLAENVGVSSMYSSCTMSDLQGNSAKAVEALHNAFVNSSGHYANMVGDHNQVGIGVHIDHAKMWVTVRFAKGDLPAGSSATALTTAPYDPDAGSGTIYRLYRAYFLREPERSGYDYWLGTFFQGYPLPSISNDFARSQEFATRYGSVSNGEFLTRVYSNVLGRGVDSGGYAYWMDKMNRGMSRGMVMIYFADSGEFRQKTAAGRPPGY
ncbi:MAG: DUF4214 domain-containing protein [Acidimicrobiia bacterium]